jgi:hypothetical protein
MIYSDPSSLQGLIQDVYYLGKINSTFISANDIQRIINKYYGQVQEAIRAVNENFYLVVATANTSLSGNTYTYPDGTGSAPAYEKIKSIWCAFTPASLTAPLYTEYTRCDIIDPDAISDPTYSFASSSPKAVVFGTYFALYPVLDNITLKAVTNGLKIYYIADQAILQNPSDTPKVFPSFQDAIVQGALIDIAQRKGDLALKKDSEAFLAKRLGEIRAYASDRLPLELGLIEGQDNIGGWEYPWGKNNMA